MAKRKKTNELKRRKDGRLQRQITITDPITGEVTKDWVYGRTQEELNYKERQKKNQQKTDETNDDITLEKWLQYCLKIKQNIKIRPNTYRSYEGAVKNHIIPYFGKKPLKSIIKKDIQEFYFLCQEKGLTSTLSDIRAILIFAFNEANDNDLIAKNPAKNVQLPELNQQVRRALTSDEEQAFLQVLENIWDAYVQNPRYHGKMTSEQKFAITAGRLVIVYYLGLYAGVRLGEALGLTWECVDFEKNQITIMQQLKRERIEKENTRTALKIDDVKSDYSVRALPVSQRLIDQINKHKLMQTRELGREPRLDELVIINQVGKKQEPRKVNSIMDRIVALAKIEPKIVYHELRHTRATRMSERNATEPEIARYLGQATVGKRGGKTATKGYIHARHNPEDLRKYIE